MELKPLLISPPFGNWINRPYATSIRGSFTWHPRHGLLYHTLRSLRPIRGGWVNQIGLRNPGLQRIKFDETAIYSLVGLEHDDWDRMLALCQPNIAIEINLGCPNVHRYGIPPETLRQFCQRFPLVIAKLPPTPMVDELAAMCVDVGVRYLHLCNTIPTARGGESGRRLFALTLPIVERIAARYSDITIIAGGGIYDADQLNSYSRAGATHFSLATIWFTPWRVPSVVQSAS